MGELFVVENGITAGILKLGIAQGGLVRYVEVADSGIGFKFCICPEVFPLASERLPISSTPRRRQRRN
jgi:hypothetical protein